MTADSSLREQLEAALTEADVRALATTGGLAEVSVSVDAIMPIFSAGLAAARADEREKIAKAIEARLTHFTAAISDPYYDRAFREAAAVARSAGVEPKEQQT